MWLIPYNGTPSHVRVHVQRTGGDARHRSKGIVQLRETPFANQTQLQKVAEKRTVGPKHRISIRIVQIVPVTVVFHVGNLIPNEFLLQAGPRNEK